MTNDGYSVVKDNEDISQHSTGRASALELEILEDESTNPNSNLKEDSPNQPVSLHLNPDIFDAELDSDGDDIDLIPLPGSHRQTHFDESDESRVAGSKFANSFSKDAVNKESKSSIKHSQIKNRKNEIMDIHSKTQRIIREARVQIPYHIPEKQGLSSVLDRIKQKRELIGISSMKSSYGCPISKAAFLTSKVSKSKVFFNTLPLKDLDKSELTAFTTSKLRDSQKTEESCQIDETIEMKIPDKESGDKSEDSNDYEDLMSRLKKKMQKEADADEVKSSNVMLDNKDKSCSNDHMENKILDVNLADFKELNNSLNIESNESAHERTERVLSKTCSSEDVPAPHLSKSKFHNLLNCSMDPSVIPKLGKFQEGDDLIIGPGGTGVDRLFQRLEKELINKPKKKQTVELCTASKQSTDAFQMETVVYKMNEKTEIKKSSRDHLREVLQLQMRESRQERMLERYEEYNKLGRESGLLRLEEDQTELSDDNDFDEDASNSESSSDSEMCEPEDVDEEEEAAERQEQMERHNPFIDNEADDDEGDDCCVENADEEDGGDEFSGDDDDDEDEIRPIKKRALKIIDEEDDDSNLKKDEEDKPLESKEKHIVNLFDEDAMSCQRINTYAGKDEEGTISCRPFEEIGVNNVLTCDSNFMLFQESQENSTNVPKSTTFSRSSDGKSISNSFSSQSQAGMKSQREDEKGNISGHREISNTFTLEMSQNEDWLLLKNPNEGRSISQAVKELCSTQMSQEADLTGLCSGSFATQKNLTFNDNTQKEDQISEKNSKKRKCDDDEEEEGGSNEAYEGKRDTISSSDDQFGDQLSENEEMLEENYCPMKTKGKINEEFVEKEAELSGSELEDDDEDGEDEMEMEEGDLDDVGSEEELRNQVNRVHMKKLIDQDKREIRLLQEHLLEDGDLHNDDGLGRMRRFRWKNLDDEVDGNNLEGKDEDNDDGAKDDVRWRMMRLEREKFLQKQQEEGIEGENQNSEIISSRIKLKLVSSFQQESPFSNHSNSARAKSYSSLTKVPGYASKSTTPKPIGSFLNRSREVLAKFSEPAKAGGSSFGSPSTSTMLSRNSRNFVFAHLSPSKKPVGDASRNGNKESTGLMPPRKKLHIENETPLPQSRILKYLNE